MDNTATAKRWLLNAEDDIRWCEASLSGGVWHGACFSAQQAAEKAMGDFIDYTEEKANEALSNAKTIVAFVALHVRSSITE